jgi:hypothetical protein
MNRDIFDEKSRCQTLLTSAREALRSIRSHPSPTPPPNSPAHAAFDPFIVGRLTSFVPLRVVDPCSTQEAWDAVEAWLDGWEEILVLSGTEDVSTWKVWLCLVTSSFVLSKEFRWPASLGYGFQIQGKEFLGSAHAHGLSLSFT